MLKGILPAIPTCFTDRGNINLEAQKKVIQFVISAGAHGIVFPGVASEYNFLTSKERIKLIKLLVSEVNGIIPIVAGISAPSIKEVTILAEEAKENGIKHFMLMAPKRFENNLDKHISFFNDVATQFQDCEIILQNAPMPIGAGLDAQQLIQIIENNTNITYLKEEKIPSGPTISEVLNKNIPHLLGVFGGGGSRYIIDELNRGSIGAVPAAEITDLHVAIFNAYKNGEFSQARNLYRLTLPLLTSQTIYRMELTKYILKKRGVVDALYVRAPLPKLDKYAKEDLDQILKDLQEENILI
ncbi:dihydrodipicolinate synthase family protein [uncultured Maribacter sp.]|uniref:dihydrodipicolinate synthase family protein n=1 Tax=uncultured Maribacter sp. TaxID=431308 RepID=UPI0026052E4A|nr:dihydrodipicolinate synthase family protein [uncultured Maribacter sp.]